MTIRARTGKATLSTTTDARKFVIAPIAHAIALAIAAGNLVAPVHAQQAFSPAWFAQKGAVQASATATGLLPNGQPASAFTGPQQQSQAARDQLQQSITNLGNAAQAIAMQQALQQQARSAALVRATSITDGLGEGGLKIDDDALTRGWINANGPVQSVRDGRVVVDIEQTADKAILNWETFNVGRNTTVNFDQNANWSLLNRVNDPNLRPSEIQGQINAPGTVFVLNRNGILFNGASQVNVRNLVAAAVGMTDAQFGKGLYSEVQGSGHIPTFANDLQTTASTFSHGPAEGKVIVEEGARINTHVPTSVTEGGGYVMLLGGEVHNAGHITTSNGQTVLAAGDAFVIGKGMATDENQNATTRGNVISTLRLAGTSGTQDATSESSLGRVRNSGLIEANTGDITLVGQEVRQDGTLKATTSVHTRGTIHLVGNRNSTTSQVTLGEGSTTAIVLDESATTALDVQRQTLVSESDKDGDGIQHRRDQSLVRIGSGGDVVFEGDSLTLATSGQVLVDAAGTSDVQADARIDVSGYVGVKIAMEANNVEINVQGFEQRDAPVNRDGDNLRNSNIWLDRRDLVLVPAGTNGYETDRWYTAGGLLEVGGYLGITGHGIGEWSAQGGTVQFTGGHLATHAGSVINLSGGALDVQTGRVNLTWLKGIDGNLYNASTAPGDLLYTGLYRGFESSHARWGNAATEHFYNPLIAPLSRLENGYVVGRDAGRLVVATRTASLDGDIDTSTFQGERQTRARDNLLDGYQQAQTTVARRGELVFGSLESVYESTTGALRQSPSAVMNDVVIGSGSGHADGIDGIALDAAWLNALDLGALRVYARAGVTVDDALSVSHGGSIALHATQVDVNADLTARGGSIAAGNIVERLAAGGSGWLESPISAFVPAGYTQHVRIGEGVTLDARGVWNNLSLDSDNIAGIPFIDGGRVSLLSGGNVELLAGSLIDVSSGATQDAERALTGGRGGDVRLGAGVQGGGGSLTFDGDVRGHGVRGGGALSIEHGTLVSIGGAAAQPIEQLPANTASELPLRLATAHVVQPGETIPLGFSYLLTVIGAGQPIVPTAIPEVTAAKPLTLQADWVVPATTIINNAYVQAGATVPAGTVLTRLAELPVGYVVPADAFPNGLPVYERTISHAAGTVATMPVIIPIGTRIPPGTSLPFDIAVQSFLEIDPSLFRSGFASYAVEGRDGVQIAPGAALVVEMPVLQLDREAARLLPSGADPSTALSTWLPPLQMDDAIAGSVSLRRGADLSLAAGSAYGAGALLMGTGSRISVDPGRSVTLVGNDQITLDGTIQAHGGRISVLPGDLGFGANANAPASMPNPRSLWIGENAVLDVSGRAFTAVAANGRSIGRVLDGGRIEIGGRHDLGTGNADAITAFVVVREGARLDASGASGMLHVPGVGDTVLASHGGSISLSSGNGLFVDGDLQAQAGGAGAFGGSLALNLETPVYQGVERFSFKGPGVDDAVRVPRELVIEQVYSGSGLDADVQVGQMHDSLAYGHARYGVDAIHAGGFDTATLHVNGLLSFDGDVDLRMDRALYLTASGIGLSTTAARDSQVHLAAPYLRLSGSTRRQGDNTIMPNPVFGSRNTTAASGTLGVPLVADASGLVLSAGMIDIVGEVGMGARGSIIRNVVDDLVVERDAFGTVRVESEGDLRLRNAQLFSPGDVTLAAAQIYGSGGVTVGLLSTLNQWGSLTRELDPDRRLDIERSGTALPAMPYSVFGAMSFIAATINQGGVLRAPLGSITLGAAGGAENTSVVNLLPGSVTSVSANGLVMPYGGTVDGLIYNYNGVDAVYQGIGFEPRVEFRTHALNAQAGAVVDLSGGGELTGAAFLQGRGGSTDARFNPLVQLNDDGFTLPGLATNPIYAIVPGDQAIHAPVGAESGAGNPAIGRQITIGEGVPGLPAGTYTLLPSTYALLPGAFRVELNGLADSGAAFGTTSVMRNGSWSTAARLGVANTGMIDVQSTQVILTAADTLRRYSQYNETGYAQFALNQAAREGIPAPLLERDGKALNLALASSNMLGAQGLPQLVFDATLISTPGEGGHGTVLRLLNAQNYEILRDGATPTDGFDGVSVHASALNDIGASRMEIGGTLTSTYINSQTGSLQGANVIRVGSNNSDNIVLREGATLRAADVFMMSSSPEGGLVLEQGAGIDTLGRGASTYGSERGYIYQPGSNSILAVSNARLDLLAPTPTDSLGNGAGAIEIGICASGALCSGETRLYSEGTIATATDNRFVLGDTVRYGTRNLSLALGGVNVGSTQALAEAEANGTLPSGITLNQQVIDRLLLGDTSTGAPALEALTFTVRESVNFFGDVSLSTYHPQTGASALQQLVLSTPAIYGHGSDTDVARIHTDTLIWTGARTPAGAVVAGGPGTGNGQLVVDAREIVFGYGPQTQPDTVRDHDRLALGFASVHLNASERVTATHKGTLSVYQAQGAWDAIANAYPRSGGNLFINTALLTGTAGSVNRIVAGGDIQVSGTGSPAADNATLRDALGAEIALDSRAGNLVLDTAVLLPSGRLSLSAHGDVTLADGAQLDLAGRKIDFFDVDKYSWGGDVLLDSRTGDVRQSLGSQIDLSAEHNRAGKLGVVATQGTVDLSGVITAASSGHYDAGGTDVPYLAGRIDVHGRDIADFAGLNARLNDGGVTGSRGFRLGQGDLVIGDDLRAHEVSVSLDDGKLMVNGTIDASGEQAGSIRLSARNGVTLGGQAVLDASAGVLRVDSYGKPIDAPNRAVIEIDAGQGALSIASGARMDLRVTGADAAYGTVALSAPRVGGDDVAIDASGVVVIDGARTIHVNAFASDGTAALGGDTTTDGRTYQVVDQAYLDRLHGDSDAFIAAALANGALMDGKLSGLRAYGEQFHLRPAIEVVADLSINPDGDLHVDGDIDLSGHRYASVNPNTPQTGVHGSGEAGVLVLRAQGNLDVFGSISDGFDGSRLEASYDSTGWVLTKGRQLWGSDVVVPHAGMVTLDAGTVFNAGKILNYDLPINPMQMASGTLLPAQASLAQPLALARGTVLSAAVYDATGTPLYAAGTVLGEAVTLPANARLDAGFRLSANAQIGAMTWPAGVALPSQPLNNFVVLSTAIALDKGALIPSDTEIRLPGGVDVVDLRPRDAEGNQGRIWALAPMLDAGAQSFDISLVAGADIAAADRLATLHSGAGQLRFSDMHYGMGGMREAVPGTGEPATYRWADDIDAATWESWGLPPVTPGAIMREDELQLLFDWGFIGASPMELNDWGLGNTVAFESEGTPPDYEFVVKPVREQLPSVVRTGTGDLRLVSAGDIATSSLFGIYTAGTPSASLAADAGNDPYNLPRSTRAGAVLGAFGGPFEALVNGGADSLYQAWYPEAGGNLLLRAGGNVSGDSIGRAMPVQREESMGYRTSVLTGTASVGNWLWRQGSGSVAGEGDTAVPTAWWINFGTYVPALSESYYDDFTTMPRLMGFTGFGTLGGGNLVLEAGGNAGMLQGRGDHGAYFLSRSSGLNLTVASTGRVTAAGEQVLTGGGDLDIRIGGGLNADPTLNAFSGSNVPPIANSLAVGGATRLDLNGAFTNLRGALRLEAGAVGSIALQYGSQDVKESRAYDVFTATTATPAGGPVLVLGDAGVRLEARGDLVLGNAIDAGRVAQFNDGTPFGANGQHYAGNGWSWFSLWTPSTAIDLLSAGGHLTPTLAMHDGVHDSAMADLNHVYPSVLRAAAASGNLYYGRFVKSQVMGTNNDPYQPGVVLAPSLVSTHFANGSGGQLELLAAGSIYAQGTGFSMSGADPTLLPTPFNPGFVGRGGDVWYGLQIIHNVSADASAPAALLGGTSANAGTGQRYPLFAFTPPTASGHVYPGQAPARYYAVEGDLVGLRTGSIVYRGGAAANSGQHGMLPTWYDGGGAVAIRAGRDIVNAGTALGAYDNIGSGSMQGPLGWMTTENRADPSAPHRADAQQSGTSRGNLIVHTSADDVSVVEAGRDIRFSTFYIAGPGLLDISAGRDVYMADKAELRSLGPVVNVTPGDRSSGAGISVAAGMGLHGADWTAFAARYLDPANQADLELPLADQPGKVVYVYDGELTLALWLGREFGYSGDEAGAAAFLASQQQALDTTRAEALAVGRTAANRDIAREYRLESQLHLVNWLSQRFGGANGRGLHFDAATMDARSFFASLPPEQQSAFLRNVYYAELKASGREYNEVAGRRFGSYLRGREAIETLLPSRDADGHEVAYQGDLTMFSSALYFLQNVDTVATWRPQPGRTYLSEAQWIAAGRPPYDTPFYKINDAGIHTDFGGDIHLMVPGGQTLIGVDGGYPPGAGSGVLTQGEGDINIYSLDDILMGQSRVFTTFGGNILAWAAEGDINAGRGAKTTVVATPQRRVYDDIGNVSLSPSTPNTGAGIATLNPIPEVPPGDIDLIAPLGTIDAGEAGIRVSGQVNLAALQVLNAENIQVQGEATGLPVIAAVNIGALTSASAAANSAVQAAQDMVQRKTQQARPSVISVEVLGFGSGPSASTGTPREAADGFVRMPYDPTNPVQFVGVDGQLDPASVARLTVAQRQLLQE